MEELLEYWLPLNSGLAIVDEASCVILDGIMYTKVLNQPASFGAYGAVFIVKRVGGDLVTLCAKELML